MTAVVRTQELRRFAVTALGIVVVAAAYYGAGRLGLIKRLYIDGATCTPLWPPTGVALAALLFMGLRIWPGIALGALGTVLTLGPLGGSSFVILAGNTIAPVCAYLVLRRLGFQLELERLRDGFSLVVVGALAGILISPTVGTSVLVVDGTLPEYGFWPVWTAWWTGDAMGVLVVTPLFLLIRKAWLARVARGPGAGRPLRDTYRTMEVMALVVAVLVVVPLVTHSAVPLLFLVFPVLIWAALRFQLAGAVPIALFISVLTIVAATDGSGPFVNHSLTETMIALQALNGSVALTALLLAAIVTEQRNVHRKIEQVCVDLAEVVENLAPGKSAKHWPPEELGAGGPGD